MIKKTLLAIFTVVLIASCDNELDITADWNDVPVVYGILNSQDSNHYIKLNKVFLGQGDVMSMAQEFDSIHYNQDDIGLRLIEYSLQASKYIQLRTIEMEPSSDFIKPDGIFSHPDQVIYKTSETINHERFYAAEVYDKRSDLVIAKNSIPIDILSPLQVTKPNQFTPLNLVPLSYLSKAEWTSVEGGKLYELQIRFYYVEQQITNLSDTVHKYIDWIFPYRQSTNTSGGESMSISIDPDQFLNFLAVNIEENPNVYRQVSGILAAQTTSGFSITHACMDFSLLSAGEDLSTYIMLNENSNSIVLDRPEYSNIENGIGILSSRSIDIVEGIKINNDSNDEIAFNPITKHLNFAYFRFGGDNQIDTLYVN